MNLPASELGQAERPRAAALKFTHPSGSRPLEGYTIKRGVGRGGFGEVYFATSDAGKEVALKLIRRNLEVELRGVTQCLNLKHPNLIALYDIRTDEMGDQWVIMEYVSGESLEDVIERYPSGIPIDQVLWWVHEVCRGVAYLHDHGIVHRDLKPGNIFSDEGTVKIGDYGLAKFISCSRRSGQTESVGTVHYMAPEIANGRYGREIDTYALGIILFEMLTGRVPFEGESVGEVLMKHLTAEPDLSALAEPYRDIVRRALAKDPNVRINSVGEMVSLLPGGVEGAGAPRYAAATSGDPDNAIQRAVREADARILREIRGADARIASDIREADASLARELGQATNGSPAVDDQKVEEPIWKALRESFSGANLQNMHPIKKGVLLFAVVALCLWYFDSLVSLAIPVLICYWIYHAIWSSWAKPSAGGAPASGMATGAVATATANGVARSADQHTVAWTPSGEKAAARASQAERRRRLRPNWRDRAQRELAARPWRDKFSELLGSMLLAAVFAMVAACVALLVLAQQPASEQLAMYLWLATVGTLGSWAILVPSKIVEGQLEDQVPMRLTQLALGALVGLAAWVLGETLLLESPHWGEPVDAGHGLITHELFNWPAPSTDMNPALAMYVTYFAFLFLVPRWWRQTEYTRTGRMSLWAIIVCLGWAWLLHIFWWFPQPTGMMAAGVIATATQLASPWMPPSKRRTLAAEIEGGVV